MKKYKTVRQQIESVEKRIMKTDSSTELFDKLIDKRNQLLVKEHHG